MKDVKLNLIAAMCSNRGIGIKGTLPWKIKKDMNFFNQMTSETKDPEKQNAVIMGRKTWDSIPEKFRPLANRVNIVLSRHMIEKPTEVSVVDSLEKAIGLITDDSLKNKIESVFVIGGSSVYKEALLMPCPCRIYLTRIQEEFECDTFFPEFGDEFKEIPEVAGVPGGEHTSGKTKFTFHVYEKSDK